MPATYACRIAWEEDFETASGLAVASSETTRVNGLAFYFVKDAIGGAALQVAGQCPRRQDADMDDAFNLQRFVDAQRGVIERVYSELRAGRKQSHWMWFVFPQVSGLGTSRMAQEYAISSLAEAGAYMAHPVLGPRLKACAELVNAIEGKSIEDIFGYPDHLKFHSSMTLFAGAAPDEPVFERALRKFFDGKLNQATLDRLR